MLYPQNHFQRKKTLVVFPFAEVAQKPSLSSLRSINISESLSRVYEMVGDEVRRVSAILNYSTFHGLLYAKIYDQIEAMEKGGKKEDTLPSIRLDDLAQYLL